MSKERSPFHNCILLVTDSGSNALAAALRSAGFDVRIASFSADLAQKAERERPALILISGARPSSEKASLCRGLRSTPVLAETLIAIVGPHGPEAECIAMLEAGADDYISEPISSRELIARVKAVLRRRYCGPAEIVNCGVLTLDVPAMKLLVAGNAVSLSVTEFRLLALLMRHPDRVFSRERILEEIWQDSRNVGKRAVDVYIRRIREKIGDQHSQQYLATVRGAGYMFHAV
jgi:two-component system phosphate regulon response regulator PhoB